jgi:hypothetical protein
LRLPFELLKLAELKPHADLGSDASIADKFLAATALLAAQSGAVLWLGVLE